MSRDTWPKLVVGGPFHGLVIHPTPHAEPGSMYQMGSGALVVHEWPTETRRRRFWRWLTRNPRPPSGMDLLRAAASTEETDRG
jgi:hypothetical protein